MPILNQKLFIRLFLVVVVLGGGLVVLHHVQAGRVPEALLWQADNAVERGKADKAILYLRQYLEFRPDDRDAAVRLADLMLTRAASAKDIQNAHFLYERVLREAPDRRDVARKLVTLCIQMGRFADALEHAQKLLATDKDDGVLHAQVARCLVVQGFPDEARTEYEQALAHAPNHVLAYVEYADLLERHFNKPNDAGAVLERLTRTNPNRPGALLAHARFLQRVGKPDHCLHALDRVFLLDPENGEALVMSAEILQGRPDFPRARDTLRHAIAMYPRYAHGYRALSWLDLMAGNQADALATLERGVAVLPDAAELLTPLADLYIQRGDSDRAREIVVKLDGLQKAAPAEGRRPFALRAGYLRGRLQMRDGKWNDALGELEALRTDAQGMPGLAGQLNLLLAACHERRADRDAQVEALRRALTADPNHLAARVALANALVNAGRTDDALKEFEVAARSPFAGLGVHLAWLSLRVAWARTSDAAATEWQAIAAVVTKLRAQHPESVEPAAMAAEVFAARGDFAGAEKLLRADVNARPGDPRRWAALASIVGRSRGTLAAVGAVSEGQLAAGESVELRLARGRAWADDPQPGRERRLALLEALPATAGDAERLRLLSGLADLYDVVHDDVGRMRVLAELVARDGHDLASRRVLCGLALRGDDPALRDRWRDELVRAEGPSGRSAAVLDAFSEARRGAAVPDRKLADWHDLAQGVLAASPDHADAHLLMAAIAELRRNVTEATRHIESAAALEPTDIRYQAARLGYYLRTSQDDAARRTLVRLEADPRLSGQRFRAVVEGGVVIGGPEALSKCLTWLAPHFKREPRTAVWAGGLVERAGKVTDALGLYKAATDSHPAFADGWSARLCVAARIGEAEVNETVSLAAKALDRPSFYAVCAECGAAVRAKVPGWSPPVTTPADRRAYAEACMTACEARARLEDAVPVLTAIAEDRSSPASDTAWARQTLAALTAALGSPDRKRAAIDGLRESAGNLGTIADARSRVAALSVALRSVTGDDRRVVVRESIDLLTAVVKDDSATSNDWYQLAQLHAAAGDRPSARTCLRELTRREPNNLFYLALVVDDLLAENRLDEARPIVPRLAAGVQDVRVLATAGRFHTLDNNPATVLRLTDQFVRAADPGTTDGAVRQRQAADTLDQLTRLAARKGLSGTSPLLAAACERYRASLRAFPEAVAPMATLMAYAGQVQPAFDELDRHKAGLSPTGLANAGVGIVRTGRASARQVQTVRGWIDSALATTPDSLPLKLHLGELLALQGDYSAAEPVYREVLNVDPKNLFALNNLAWILAARSETAPEALGLVERAIALGGVNGELLDTRARVLIAAGQYDRAVADLTEVVRGGGTPLQHFHLALALTRLGRTAEAVTTYRQGRERGLKAQMVHPEDRKAFVVLDAQAQ